MIYDCDKFVKRETLEMMSKEQLTDYCCYVIRSYNVVRNSLDKLEDEIDIIREQVGNIRTGVGEQYQTGFIQTDIYISVCVDESTQVSPACVFSSATSRRG